MECKFSATSLLREDALAGLGQTEGSRGNVELAKSKIEAGPDRRIDDSAYNFDRAI